MIDYSYEILVEHKEKSGNRKENTGENAKIKVKLTKCAYI